MSSSQRNEEVKSTQASENKSEALVLQPDKLEHKFEEFDLSFLPTKVAVSDLKSNMKLLDEQEIKEIEEKFKDKKDGRYSKHAENTKYGVIKLNGEYFAVYKGMKHGKGLGEGAFGKVKLVQNLNTGTWHAIKLLKDEKEEKEEKDNAWLYEEEKDSKSSDKPNKENDEKEEALKEQARKELFQAEHQTLVKLDKALPAIVTKEEAPERLQIIMNYERGKNLFHFLDSDNKATTKLSAIRWIDIILQCLRLVKELHDKGFLHRDIKLENFLYDASQNKVKLIDHGFTAEKDEKGNVVSDYMVGTEGYTAPELLKLNDDQDIIFNEETESYALGQLLKEILGFKKISGNYLPGEKPFRHNTLFTDDEAIEKNLKDMTRDSPQQRSYLYKVITFFEKKHQELLPLYNSTVGIINLSEYRASPDKSQFITALQCVHSVVLVDEKKEMTAEDKLLNIELARSLEEKGIVVRDKILTAPNINQALPHIPKHLEEKSPHELCQYYYFSAKAIDTQMDASLYEKGIQSIAVKDKNEIAYRKEMSLSIPISKDHYDKVITVLKQELARINSKYKLNELKDKKFNATDAIGVAKQRATDIADTIQQFEDKMKNHPKIFSYHFLFKELNKLEAKMVSTKQYSRYFGSFFAKEKAHGKTAIEELKTSIEKEKTFKYK